MENPRPGHVDLLEFGEAEVWRPAHRSATAPGGPVAILLARGVISADQLEAARERQRGSLRLGILDALVETEAIERPAAMEALAESFGVPFVRITSNDVDMDVFTKLPVEYLKKKLVLPIGRNEENHFVVGVTDPADIFLIDDLKRHLGSQIRLVLLMGEDIRHVIEELSVSPNQQVEDIIKDIAEDSVEVVNKRDDEINDLEKIAGESPVIRYVNFLISSAVKEDASDIHIEPTEARLRVRLRIDGVLFEQPQCPPIQMHAAIISRLKIMSNLDIAERRLPQDGRIRATVHGRTVDLRVSMLPLAHGEKCVIRILDNRSIMVGLENLGMWDDTLDTFRNEIIQPHGIVLVTGPTGSGKSTTLYSALRVMDSSRLNISTVEDPVEYELDTINQVAVHDKIGMSFAAALRSLLRQDPDVVMVGEIRDEETARIAVQASLTGHLVLSTLHTNDAPSSITRLVNIGVEPYLISAALNAVLAQRLVRRLCEHCKTTMTEIPSRVAVYLERRNFDPENLYVGAGCDKCRQTGYKGRLGIYEMLTLNDELRDIVTRNPSLNELRAAAKAAGMRSLREDGMKKLSVGLTTVDELMRVTET